MDLSNNLISQFAKLTATKKEKKSESIVYGTTVEYDNKMYVKIDGSDLITPIETTADIKPNQRVTVMIKDHTATVTGNVTSPSASSHDLKDVSDEVGNISAEVGQFGTLIADKATIDDLKATNAEITNLKADKASINDLKAINADIDNLKADKASIDDLKATNAEINNLKADKADIILLNATNANIGTLNADVAKINNLLAGNITSDNILSFNITTDKVTMMDAFIKDAHIANINANKINAGKINTGNVTIASDDGGITISDETMQFKDKNDTVRIQIGRDKNDDFTFALYDETGKGQLINAEGIQSSDAIKDGLIRNDHIKDDANISGSKLDISSVITEVNNDNSTTIKSNKIYLDEQNQSLEVAFNSLKTQVNTIQDVTIDGDLTSIMNQVQSNTTEINVCKGSISTLVGEDKVIKETVKGLDDNIKSVNTTLTNKYSALEQDINGFKTTVANNYTTKSEFGNLQIGGTNLLLKTETEKSMTGENKTNQCMDLYAFSNEAKAMLVDQEYTVSFTYTISDYQSGTFHIQSTDTIFNLKGSEQRITPTGNGTFKSIFTSKWKETQDVRFGLRMDNFIGSLTISKMKLEKGGKATDWSPAPEDIDDQIKTTNDKFSNYSTTEQMNSAINQKADEINLSVSKIYATQAEFNNLDVGGRNLIRKGSLGSFNSTISYDETSNTWTINATAGNGGSWGCGLRLSNKHALIPYGQTYIVSFEIKVPRTCSWNADVNSYPITGDSWNGNDNDNGSLRKYSTKTITDTNQWIKCWFRLTNTHANNTNKVDLYDNSGFGVVMEDETTNMTYYIRNVKGEIGTIPSAWSPAPEDIQGAIDAINDNLAVNYSTTSQMNSAINQKADAISLSVSKTYTTQAEFNNLSVGGSNLIANSAPEDLRGWSTSTGWRNELVDCTKAPNGKAVRYTNDSGTNGCGHKSPIDKSKFVAGEDYTLSAWIRASKTCTISFRNERMDSENYIEIGTDWKRITCTKKMLADSQYHSDIFYVTKETCSTGMWLEVHSLQLEKGNKATDWSPAPEDAQAQINATNDNLRKNYSTTSQMNSAINQKADSILSTVSNTYVTNNTLKGYSTTNQMNSAINQKADSILSTVSNTYVTNNTLKGYSTTNQMNSAINQKADSILSTVSNTYVTNNTLKGYSTTNQMNSAINQKADSILSTVSNTYVTNNTLKGYSTTNQMNSAINQKADSILSTVSNTYISDSDASKTYATKSELNQTSESWTATFESGFKKGIVEMNQYGIKVTHSDFAGWTHITSSGFYVHNGTEDVVMCTTNGLTVKGTLTASNIYGSYMASDSSSAPTFSLNSSGEIYGAKIDCKSLSADGVISTSTLIVDNISNKAYPKALVAGGTIYVNSSTGDDDNEFKAGNKFATLQGAIDSIPKNMNGKSIKIQLENNVTENVDINYFASGTLSIYCNGKTIYGYINVKGCSSYVYILGGSTASSSNNTGVIHPRTGVNVGDRTCSVGAVQSNYVSIQHMKIYAADKQASGLTANKVCVASMTAANVYINTVAVTKTDVGFRATSMASIHANKSSGVAAVNGFQAGSGGKISFANNSQTGGKQNATYSSTGGQIWLGSSTTFEGGNQSTDTNTAPSTTVTKTATYTANYADTYRSTVYKNWKKDGTARQGNWGYGNCTGCWFFGDDFENISGKNVTKVQITFTRQSGGHNASRTHYFYTHDDESRPNGAPSLKTAIGTASAAVGDTVTYTITNSTYISAIKSAKGIAIRDTSYSKDKYSVCSGTMKVKFTYTVTT